MNNDAPVSCPHCGSRKLVAHASSRRIYIDHNGEEIELLTTHFQLGKPIIEASATTYTCSCSWSGTAANSRRSLSSGSTP